MTSSRCVSLDVNLCPPESVHKVVVPVFVCVHSSWDDASPLLLLHPIRCTAWVSLPCLSIYYRCQSAWKPQSIHTPSTSAAATFLIGCTTFIELADLLLLSFAHHGCQQLSASSSANVSCRHVTMRMRMTQRHILHFLYFLMFHVLYLTTFTLFSFVFVDAWLRLLLWLLTHTASARQGGRSLQRVSLPETMFQ